MRKWLAMVSLLVGAAMLQGCVYNPNSGTYAPAAGYGYGTYPAYGAYGYPAYGYPAYGPSYGGSVTFGGVWGGGDRGGDWNHRGHDAHREGDRREDRQPGHAGHPVNLGAGYRPHAEGGHRAPAPSGGHGDHDHDHDHNEQHH